MNEPVNEALRRLRQTGVEGGRRALSPRTVLRLQQMLGNREAAHDALQGGSELMRMGASSMAAQRIIGIDIGSTTVKSLVVDWQTRDIVWSGYRRHETRQAAALEARAIHRICWSVRCGPVEWSLLGLVYRQRVQGEGN